MKFRKGDVVMICRDTVKGVSDVRGNLGAVGIVEKLDIDDPDLDVLVDPGDSEGHWWWASEDLELLERST